MCTCWLTTLLACLVAERYLGRFDIPAAYTGVHRTRAYTRNPLNICCMYERVTRRGCTRRVLALVLQSGLLYWSWPSVATKSCHRRSKRRTLDRAGKSSASKWVQISQKAVGFSFNDYPEATHIRQCVTFTDSSGAGGGMKLRLKWRKGGKIYFEDDVAHTWSGSGLIHHECGA